MKALEVVNLTKSFGGLMANGNLSFHLDEKEILGLIGPNGAGKTTTFNLITGIHKPDGGHVYLNAEEITGLRPDRITARGISRTFQGVRIFSNLTVKDNILAGLHLRLCPGLFVSLYRDVRGESQTDRNIDLINDLLRFFQMDEYMEERADSLSHFHQSLLGIAMAMITEPMVLLLDEPLAGLNSEEIEVMLEIISKLRSERGVSILLVEHVMSAVMRICERLVVLDYGQKIAEGSPTEISNNDKVISAYLGRAGVAYTE